MMRCVFCGGKVTRKHVTFAYDEGGKYLFVENVPAEVCQQCGERTYSPEVTDNLLQYAESSHEPIRTIQVPVFRYASRS